MGKSDKTRLSVVFSTVVTVQYALAILIAILCEIVGVWYVNNMMNINNNMQNMAMGMQGMNMFMPMNGMMNNMNFGMQNLNQEDPEEWTLRFDKPGREKVYVKISKEKPFKEAINLYKSKSNDAQNNSFIFNANKLSPEVKICESGLKNNSYIVVISNDDIIG